MALLRHGRPVTHSGWLYTREENGDVSQHFFRLSGSVLSNADTSYVLPTWRVCLHEDRITEGQEPLQFILESDVNRPEHYYARSQDEFEVWGGAFRRACDLRFLQFYNVGETLGQGAFAVVKICKDRTTQEEFAVKIVNKESYHHEEVQYIALEMEVSQRLNHPSILPTHDIFDSKRNVHLVTEYMRGGELYAILAEREFLSEREAALILRELIRGVAYLHGQGVVHCDIKPDNILCSQREWPFGVKLCDFGLAHFYDQNQQEYEEHGTKGTPGYMAPEVIRQEAYGPPVDMWSCGVVLYNMLSGQEPFYGRTERARMKRTTSGVVEFPGSKWEQVSENAIGLVKGLLQLDPQKRLTAAGALQHPWLEEAHLQGAESLGNSLRMLDPNVRQRFRAFVAAVQTFQQLGRLAGVSSDSTSTVSEE